MASSIDPTKPVQGNPTTLSVRDNFSAAKSEIEGLQAGTDIVSASTTVSGVVELATGAETNTGTDATRAVTPDGLNDWTGSAQVTTLGTIATGTWQGDVIGTSYLTAASDTVAGVVELATIAETNTGTSTTLALTPDGLDGWTGSVQVTTLGTIATGTWQGDVVAAAYLPNASATAEGVVELATQAEVDAGTDTTRVVTAETYAGGAKFLHKTSEVKVLSGTSYSINSNEAGNDFVYTSGSAVTVTVSGALAVGFQCTLTQAGAGTVTLTSTDNLNGGSADIDIPAQWKTVWLMQYSEGNWLVGGV